MLIGRQTTYNDAERLADNLLKFNPSINDRDSYDATVDEYLYGTNAARNDNLLDKAFNIIKKNKDSFSRAGGKDLKRDQKQTSSRVVTSRTQYVKLGAQNVDLKGFDTKQPKTRVFNTPYVDKSGTRRFAEQTKVTIRGKTQTRYRDEKGRYTTIRRDKKQNGKRRNTTSNTKTRSKHNRRRS